MNIQKKQFVIQNPLLTGVLLWRFARAYLEADSANSGPVLPKGMIALAVLFHRRSVETIRGMQKASGLLKALNDEPLIRLGLQERLEAFGPSVFAGVNVASAAGLLTLSTGELGWPAIVPSLSPRGLPAGLQPDAESIGDMLKAGDRLGPWFAAFGLPTLCSMLQVRF